MQHGRLALVLAGLWACGAHESSDTSVAASMVGLSRSDDDCETLQGEDNANWRSFGRDYQNTRHNPDEHDITRKSVATLKRVWEVDTRAQTGTPAVVDGVVYTGDAAGTIGARDATSGELIWKQDIGRPVTSSPLVTDSRVIVSDGSGVLNAFARDNGDILWQSKLDYNDYADLYSSPIAVDGIVVIGVASNELVVEKDEYTFRGSVVGVDIKTGEERWRFYTTYDNEESGAGVSVWSSAAIDTKRHLLYIGTGQTYEAPASKYADGILAIDYKNGKLAWNRQFTADDVYRVFSPPPKGPDADVGAAPNLFKIKGRDVVGVGDKAGIYSVLDRETGATVWTKRLTKGAALGGVMTAAAFADNTIYVTSNDWGQETDVNIMPEWDNPANKTHIFALNAKDGSTLWETVVTSPTIGV